MSAAANDIAANGKVSLRKWQLERLPVLRETRFLVSNHFDDVTIVAYSFLVEGDEDSCDFLECSLLQSWAVLGMLKATIVSNRRFPKVDAFAEAHADWVDVQIEPSLVPGRIESMSADCDGRLHSRFNTPY